MSILEMYETGSDIMQIAKKTKNKPSYVISQLVKEGIISKRSEARGYKKYISTDEYKENIKKFEAQKQNGNETKKTKFKVNELSLERRISALEKTIRELKKETE